MLPNYTIAHKADWFIKENYTPDIQKDNLSFLSRSFERHFNERPYLNHACFLFLTKTTKERMRAQSNFNTLCRGFLVPKEIRDRETVTKFLEAVGQFERIVAILRSNKRTSCQCRIWIIPNCIYKSLNFICEHGNHI